MLKLNTSYHINYFDPQSVYQESVITLLKTLKNIDLGKVDVCDLLIKTMVRRYAASFNNLLIQVDFAELSEEVGLTATRNAFRCKGIDIYDFISVPAETFNLLDEHGATLIYVEPGETGGIAYE